MDHQGVARQLEDEARRLVGGAGLTALLADRFGAAEVTGSLAYGLMVWRDIDIHCPVAAARRGDWAALLPALVAGLEAAGARLHQAQYLDDYVDPHPLGAGLYWGLQVVAADGARWKLDLWGWEPEDYAVRRARDRALTAELAAADRDLILALKTEAREKGVYGNAVLSMDVYRFVLAGAGRTFVKLQDWAASRER